MLQTEAVGEKSNEMVQEEPEIYEAIVEQQAIHGVEEGKKTLNEYVIHEEIGRGSFAKVKRVTRKFRESEDGPVLTADYAMKIFHRGCLEHQRFCFYEESNNQPRMGTLFDLALNEIQIHKNLNHRSICKLYEIIDDPEDQKDQIYLVMQLGELGTIMEFDEDSCKYLRNQKMMDYFQADLPTTAKLIFRQVAAGIHYLHSMNIVNRDVKLDNIICTTKYTKEDSIMLVDFTTARVAHQGCLFYDCAGTPGFRAPEVQFNLTEGYDPFKLDIWSFGICLYTFFHQNVTYPPIASAAPLLRNRRSGYRSAGSQQPSGLPTRLRPDYQGPHRKMLPQDPCREGLHPGSPRPRVVPMIFKLLMNLQQVQQEVSRYADINHIFDTIQKRGYLEKLSGYLEEIFSIEINFAQQRLKEVISVMQKQGAKIEFNVQLARNIQIFKSNFDLILTATANSVWNRLTAPLVAPEIEIMTRSETQPSAARKSDIIRYSEPDLKKMSQSFGSRSPSKFSSSIVKQVPFSEISCISGGSPTTFTKARRNLDNSLTTSSPGVGKYRIESGEKHIRQSSPQIAIGKSAKISWIDEKIKNEDPSSPGPIYNPVKTYCSRKLK